MRPMAVMITRYAPSTSQSSGAIFIQLAGAQRYLMPPQPRFGVRGPDHGQVAYHSEISRGSADSDDYRQVSDSRKSRTGGYGCRLPRSGHPSGAGRRAESHFNVD